ncbi:LysR substrate-binding domain-containing protein [Aminobacter anthyllidis]|uniref:LysR substrate-binding domain-containing protein n=1 Tax=Aminobacter anthyllidis TaxID=1035067 RepID=UPI0024539FE4|nr:LysR substrate-binding domain-containing protein [Aminobacter anthyllidis]MDH4989110.1 LysR substrate-binding domain-containing protein [Aminobacter anthyllidis]
MIDFNDYYYFAQVVENSGITAASNALNLPKSKLSRRISELEARLGARLIQRTPRSFLVTELGSEFYEHARKMMLEARAAETAVKRRLVDQSGTIRLSSSPTVSRICFAEIMPAFLRNFPNTHVKQEVLNRPADMINRTSDLFILSHEDTLDDSTMIQRRLLIEPRHLVASREYIAYSKLPDGPGELISHQMLSTSETSTPTRWEFTETSTNRQLCQCLTPRLASNDIFAVAAAARAGAGIAALPASVCGDDIRTGELIHILPDWTAGATMVSALLPSKQGVLPAVRALLDHITEQLPTIVAAMKPHRQAVRAIQ